MQDNDSKKSVESGGKINYDSKNLRDNKIVAQFLLKRMKNEIAPFAKQLVIVLGIFLISAMIYFFVKQDISGLRQTVQSTTQQLQAVDQGIVESKNSLLVWDEVQEQLQGRKGLDIESFRSLVEIIQLKHAISDLEITLTTPATRNDSANYQFVRLEFNIIEMNFSAITDVEAYRFLVELINKVPGILHIEQIEFSAKTDIESAIITSLKEGEIQSMVEFDVVLKWHNIIDL